MRKQYSGFRLPSRSSVYRTLVEWRCPACGSVDVEMTGPGLNIIDAGAVTYGENAPWRCLSCGHVMAGKLFLWSFAHLPTEAGKAWDYAELSDEEIEADADIMRQLRENAEMLAKQRPGKEVESLLIMVRLRKQAEQPEGEPRQSGGGGGMFSRNRRIDRE